MAEVATFPIMLDLLDYQPRGRNFIPRYTLPCDAPHSIQMLSFLRIVDQVHVFAEGEGGNDVSCQRPVATRNVHNFLPLASLLENLGDAFDFVSD